jgi:hypothetical protein
MIDRAAIIDCDHSNCGETARRTRERVFPTAINQRESIDFQRKTYVLPIVTIFHTFVRDATYLQPNLMVESVTLFRLM